MSEYKLSEKDKFNLSYDQRKQKARIKRIKEHKCYRCVYGKWTDLSFYCGRAKKMYKEVIGC